MPFFDLILIILIVVVSCFIQGVAGVGAVFILIPLLTLILGIKTTIPLVNFLATAANFYLAFQLRRHIPWKQVIPFLIMTVPGICIGAFFLKTANSKLIQIILGIVLVLFSLYLLFLKPRPIQLHPAWSYITGFVAGITGGGLGAASPPILMYTALQPWNKDFLKSFLTAYFFFCGILAFISHLSINLITHKVLILFGLCFPALVLGTLIGHLIYGKINEAYFKKGIIILILALGFLMICS
jgi:uncharacterized membrane protein YfcA